MRRVRSFAALVLAAAVPAWAGPDRVLVIHSYERGHVCGQPQHDGVLEGLREAGLEPGKDVEVSAFYMDTKRRHTTPEAIRRRALEARERLRQVRPAVVVTLDDNAFRTVALELVDTPVPVVFSGVNTPLSRYNRTRRFFESWERPGHNITGVYEMIHFVDAVRTHCKILPETRKVVFLSDRSPTGTAIRMQVLRELESADPPVPFEMRVLDSWEAYQAAVREIDRWEEPVVLYPGALLLHDARGTAHTASEILPWTVRNSRKPAIPINYAFMAAGMFGGAAVDFAGMGRQAGRMVARILRGEPPGAIPFEEARRVALVFNLDRARELGIRIPADILLAADEVLGGPARPRR